MLDLVTASAVAYPVILGFVALDAVVPMVPGETLVISGSILASRDELSLPMVIAAGIAGGMLGDSASYGLGATAGRRLVPKLFDDQRSRERLTWMREQLDQRAAVIIIAARFIPGGRTAATFAAGTLELGWSRFLPIDALAVTIWVSYAAALGYFGGETFEDSFWKPLAAATIVAALVTLLGETFRRRAS